MAAAGRKLRQQLEKAAGDRDLVWRIPAALLPPKILEATEGKDLHIVLNEELEIELHVPDHWSIPDLRLSLRQAARLIELTENRSRKYAKKARIVSRFLRELAS